MNYKKSKICHLTSAHPRDDIRIFFKMCSSLSSYGFQTNLIVADGLGNSIVDGVCIFDVGERESKRLKRMINTVQNVYEKALELNADIYHLHDPELMSIGEKLKNKGKIVIFDAHEDLPKQILGKPYLNIMTKYLLYYFFLFYEKVKCKKFDLIITATPNIRDKFLKINKNTIDINNYPLFNELCNKNEIKKENEIVYIGAISKIRGIKNIVNALEFLPDITLNLVGNFNDKKIEEEVKLLKGWNQVNFFGFLERDNVSLIMKKSKIGIVTFLKTPNHIDSQPNKMFEYMSHSLPIVTSNFDLWKEIVEGNNCGLCVNPDEPKEIASAIKKLIENNFMSLEYGQNGYKAVTKKYNWVTEEKKLIDNYKELIDENFNYFRG